MDTIYYYYKSFDLNSSGINTFSYNKGELIPEQPMSICLSRDYIYIPDFIVNNLCQIKFNGDVVNKLKVPLNYGNILDCAFYKGMIICTTTNGYVLQISEDLVVKAVSQISEGLGSIITSNDKLIVRFPLSELKYFKIDSVLSTLDNFKEYAISSEFLNKDIVIKNDGRVIEVNDTLYYSSISLIKDPDGARNIDYYNGRLVYFNINHEDLKLNLYCSKL